MDGLGKPYSGFLFFLFILLGESSYSAGEDQPETNSIGNTPKATLSVGGSEFQLSWYTIDGGGGNSSNTEFSMRGTIGQTDTFVTLGEDFTLRGGFWAIPDFTNIDFVIFKDGFESELFTKLKE